MSRPRKSGSKLPPYVRIKSGAYYFKTTKLSRVGEGEAVMYRELGKRMQTQSADSIPIAVQSFLKSEIDKLSPSAKREHERLLLIFSNVFKDFSVSQVEPADIKNACDALYTGKASAAHHFKARVSTFFRWAIMQRMRGDNPCSELRLPKVIRKRTPWTDKLFLDIRALLHPMMQVYHDLSFLCYQRTTDIRLLERSQIRDGFIRFAPSKTLRSTGAAVDIQITPQIQAALDCAASISKKWGVVCPFVIHTKQGTPYTASGISTRYKVADEKLNGKRLGLNAKALLPYACTVAHRLGASVAQIQIGRAHASMGTTEGYIQHHSVPVSAVVMELPKR